MKLVGLWVLFFVGVVNAQNFQSYCYSDPNNFSNVQGLQVDKKFPIASVSKLVTSYWALSIKGAQSKFLTSIYVTPAGNDVFDLHIQGSRDPYFGQEKIHYMISKLNEKGITKIRNLTFDENFLYLKLLDTELDFSKTENNAYAWYNYFVSPVGPNRVLSELKNGLLDNYARSLNHLAKARIKLLPQVSFRVQNMSFLQSNKYFQKTTTKSYVIRSAPLYRLLKEMNRNSNNFVAVEIFKMLGGREKFATFIKQQLGFGPESIVFHEGSGNRVAQAPVYNQATCRTLLTIFRELSRVAQKAQLDIDDVVSVLGEDGLVQGATYSSDMIDKSGVAKTGSSAAAMTLGGMLNTKPNRLYFMYNVNPIQYVEQNKNVSRKMIGVEVKKLARRFADSLIELDYRKAPFASFDPASFDETFIPTVLH